MKPKSGLDWLLEEDQPTVRFLTLTQLLDRPLDDSEVVAARDMMTRKGWGEQILAKQDPRGWWVGGESLYQPKYQSTNWMLLILADLGLSKADPRIEKACDLWIERFSKDDGGFSMDGSKKGHLCVTGNATRALVQFGYADHPAVRGAFEWLVKKRGKKGGVGLCLWGGGTGAAGGGSGASAGSSQKQTGGVESGGGGAGGDKHGGEDAKETGDETRLG